MFSIRGYAILAEQSELLPLAALCNSAPFDYIFKVALGRFGFPEFVVGVLQQLPIPELTSTSRTMLSQLMSRAWLLKRKLDTVEETSHAFVLPAGLRRRLGDYEPPAVEAELSRIQAEIDSIGFALYGFSELDRAVVEASTTEAVDADVTNEVDEDADFADATTPVDEVEGLCSWAVGVAFGRFDWRLATGARDSLQEPGPFDPLPSASAGMLPQGAAPFHAHSGILVDEVGHPHDLVRLTEEVLTNVNVPVPADLRRWLQRDFFPVHLQRYSKSRRKAPIYWPLSTASGSYTLWIYYPSLTSQTLYTAVNDFLEGPAGKIAQVGALVANLRAKGSGRTRDDERKFETLQTFELELVELRDSLLRLAPSYRPSHDDGVQISAAPLWPLFRYKPWQKLLKETWAKLENGDYDWAYLAMNYWPDRVREKCKTDKSLAMAHGLESLYVEPETAPKKTRGRKKGAEA